MNFWLDRNSESNNVVVLQQNNILVGSCDQQAYDNVFTQLTADVAPIEVLGTEDIQIIPFDKLQNLTSKNTDTSIDLQYLAKKGTEDFTLDFETLEQKNACLQLMTAREFPQLSLTVAKQSALSASISPVLSLLCAIGLGSLYIDRLRWVTIIVCGLWALLSLYGLYQRATNPPVVTKLSLKGRYGRKFVSGVKTAGGYLFIGLIAFVGTAKIPLMYGEEAIAEHSQLESLDARDVSSLIANGADVNYRTKEGYTSLHNAIYAGDTELVVALITAGADVNLPVADDGYNNAFELAIYTAESPVILALLDAPGEWANAVGLLELAIQNELDNEVIAKLAARGADLNEVNEDGENLLYIALMNDAKYELIAYLYNQGVGADFMIDDLSPADYAKSLQRFDLVALFKSQNKSDLVAVNQPKSAFLTQFIQQESDIILKSKGNMMVKVLIATDEESKTEWHAMAENNIQLKAIDVYSKSDLFDVFLTHCPALDSDFTKKMEAVFSKYTHVKQDYIKAGAEVINNNAILTHEEKTVLSGRFAQVLVERKNTLISSFTNVTTETKSELLSQCNDAILNAEADEQLAKVNAY